MTKKQLKAEIELLRKDMITIGENHRDHINAILKYFGLSGAYKKTVETRFGVDTIVKTLIIFKQEGDTMAPVPVTKNKKK